MILRSTLLISTMALSIAAFTACSDDSETPTPDTTIPHKDGSTDILKTGDGGTDSSPSDTAITDGSSKDAPTVDSQAHDILAADFPPTPSGHIAKARAAVDGTTNISITGAFVTYIKPAIGDDLGGFFIQAEKMGPALFVAIDPATITPTAPKVGDAIDLTVTEMATDPSTIRYAKAVTAVTPTTPATDPLPGLLQNIDTATDLVSKVGDYEVELITGTFTITDDFSTTGKGFVAAKADTATIKANTNLKLRVAQSLQPKLGLIKGCVVTIKATPMWFFQKTAQPSATLEADIATYTCPKPTVVSAAAMTATSIRVTFDRSVATVNANGSEFTFDNGLSASAATLGTDGTSVDVTTTAQTEGTSYTVTVAATVLDALGQGVDATKNTATFFGYTLPAKIVINEVNANLPDGCDLIELRVTSDGNLGGLQVKEKTTVLYTFPATFAAKAGDIIVVHVDSADTTHCNASGATDETTSITEKPASTYSQNFDTAYDVYSPDKGLTATTNVLTLVNVTGKIVDAVLLHDGTTGSVAGTTLTAASIVGTANQWSPVPTGGFTAANYRTEAVTGLKASSSVTGNTIQRANATDTNAKTDWHVAAGTFGAKNVGQ